MLFRSKLCRWKIMIKKVTPPLRSSRPALVSRILDIKGGVILAPGGLAGGPARLRFSARSYLLGDNFPTNNFSTNNVSTNNYFNAIIISTPKLCNDPKIGSVAKQAPPGTELRINSPLGAGFPGGAELKNKRINNILLLNN